MDDVTFGMFGQEKVKLFNELKQLVGVLESQFWGREVIQSRLKDVEQLLLDVKAIASKNFIPQGN